MSEPEQNRPESEPDKSKPEMTQEELQRQLLETQKRLVELQEQQIRKKDSQTDNHDTGIGKSVVSILIAAVIIAVVGFVIHDYTKTKEVNEHASDNIYDALNLGSGSPTDIFLSSLPMQP